MGIEQSGIMRVLLIALIFAAVIAVHAEEAKQGSDAEDEMTGDPEKDGKKEMGEMDLDKDGKATMEEIKTFMKTRYYSKADDLKDLQNDDGKPATPDDITKMIAKDAQELVDELDKDKSGDLNLQEVIAQYKDDGADEEEDSTPGDEEGGDEGGEEEGSETGSE